MTLLQLLTYLAPASVIGILVLLYLRRKKPSVPTTDTASVLAKDTEPTALSKSLLSEFPEQLRVSETAAEKTPVITDLPGLSASYTSTTLQSEDDFSEASLPELPTLEDLSPDATRLQRSTELDNRLNTQLAEVDAALEVDFSNSVSTAPLVAEPIVDCPHAQPPSELQDANRLLASTLLEKPAATAALDHELNSSLESLFPEEQAESEQTTPDELLLLDDLDLNLDALQIDMDLVLQETDPHAADAARVLAAGVKDLLDHGRMTERDALLELLASKPSRKRDGE